MQLRTEVKDGYKLIGKQDAVFKPAKSVRDLYGVRAPYEHMVDRVEVKKNYRDEEGHVITAPRNFITNPAKKKLIALGEVGKAKPLGGNFPSMAAIDNAKEVAKKEMELHQAKLQEGKPFSQRVRP